MEVCCYVLGFFAGGGSGGIPPRVRTDIEGPWIAPESVCCTFAAALRRMGVEALATGSEWDQLQRTVEEVGRSVLGREESDVE